MGLLLWTVGACLVGCWATPSPHMQACSLGEGEGACDDISALQSVAGIHRAPKGSGSDWHETNFEQWLSEHQHERAKRQGMMTVGSWSEATKPGQMVTLIYDDLFQAGIVGGANSSAPCNYSCRYTGEHGSDSADVLMINMYASAPESKRPGQIWVGHFWEAPVHRLAIFENNSRNVDFTASYRPDSSMTSYDMMMTTTESWTFQGAGPKHAFQEKRRHAAQTGAMMSAWISSSFDETERMALLESLDENGIGVFNYGGNNDSSRVRRAPNAGKIERTQEAMHEEAGWYLFFYAAENARCPYYHTEKVFNGLRSGSIPVYVGHRTVEEYLPSHSYINADDFADSEELAAYLKRVAEDERLYNSFFEWHHKPLPPHITSKLQDASLMGHKERVRCDFCEFLHVTPLSGRHVHLNGCVSGSIQVKPIAEKA